MVLVRHFWISIPSVMNTFCYMKIVKQRLNNFLQTSAVQKKAHFHLAAWFWKPLAEKGILHIFVHTQPPTRVYINIYMYMCVCIYVHVKSFIYHQPLSLIK